MKAMLMLSIRKTRMWTSNEVDNNHDCYDDDDNDSQNQLFPISLIKLNWILYAATAITSNKCYKCSCPLFALPQPFLLPSFVLRMENGRL